MEDHQDGRRLLGGLGEDAAVRYLKKKRWAIVHRGFRLWRGEIDIIADDHGTLVFIEVKTRRGRGFGPPEEAVTGQKQDQIRRIAQGYLLKNHPGEVPCRFDVISVSFDANEQANIAHIKNAF